LIGDSGTGKSHLLIALGTEAAISGFRVKYTMATKLAHELVEAADEKTLSKTIARYGRGRSAVHRRTRVHAAGPPPRGVVWNQTNIESASMPKVVSELTYKRCRIWDLAHIW
jgi:hypothetical protein